MSEPIVYAAFSAGSDLIAEGIRAFTGGDVNHALLLYKDPVTNRWMTLGANGNGLTPMTLKNFSDPILHVYGALPTGLLTGVRALADLIDEPYDYAGLIGMAEVEVVAHIFNRIKNNPTLDRQRLFCSEYVAKVARASGYDLLPGVPAGSVDPYALCCAFKQCSAFAEYSATEYSIKDLISGEK